MQMPATFEALTSPEIGDTARRYLQGADADGENRMKIVKAVWDAVGTESASRHELYERFALGPPHITSMIHLHEGNLDVYEALADDLLGSYSLEDAIAESKNGWKPSSLATSPRPAAVRTGAVEGEGTIASVSKQGIKVPRPNPIVAMSKQKR
jgi:4-hydroxyphenylacetate 3-monooxygenase